MTPLITPFKIFLQDLSLAKIEWDDILPEHLLHKWRSLIEGLHPGDSRVTLPRCVMQEHQTEAITYCLYGFGDAFLKAYAAAIYLQMEKEGCLRCHLICSKSRVSPVERLTIPRLELLSTLILSRLVSRVSEALKSVLTLEPPTCFLDSKVAYYWINGQDRSWKPFVQNRVAEIRRRVPPSRWRHCTGETNLADAPSIGQNMADIIMNPLWFTGPEICLLGTNGELMEWKCLPSVRVKFKSPIPKHRANYRRQTG